MDNNEKIGWENLENKSDSPLSEDEKKAFEERRRFLDAVLLEVEVANRQIIDLICQKLSEENTRFNSVRIDNICKILSKLNNLPPVELLQECLKCLGEPKVRTNEQG